MYMVHCFLVSTDLTLTTNKLMELFQSVKDPDSAGVYRRSIKDLLGLPQSAVKEIKRNFKSTTQRKEAYLDTYTHRHPFPTWTTIVEALRLCNLRQQAQLVEETYVQGTTLCVHTFTIRATCVLQYSGAVKCLVEFHMPLLYTWWVTTCVHVYSVYCVAHPVQWSKLDFS